MKSLLSKIFVTPLLLVLGAYSSHAQTLSEITSLLKENEGSRLHYNLDTLVEDGIKQVGSQYSHVEVSESEWRDFFNNSLQFKLRSKIRKNLAQSILRHFFQVDDQGAYITEDEKNWEILESGKLTDLELTAPALEFMRLRVVEARPDLQMEDWEAFESDIIYRKVHMSGKRMAWAKYVLYPLPKDIEILANAIQIQNYKIPKGSYVNESFSLPEEIIVSGTIQVSGLQEIIDLCFDRLLDAKHVVILDESLFEPINDIYRMRVESILVDELQNASDREFFPNVFDTLSPTQSYIDRECERRSLIASLQYLRDSYGLDFEAARNDFYHQFTSEDLSAPALQPTRQSKKLDELIKEAFQEP